MDVDCLDRLDDARAQAWDAFLAAAERQHPRQARSFARAEAAIGRRAMYAIGSRDGVICAIALLSCIPHPFWPGAWRQVHCLSGPVCDDIGDMTLFLRHLRSHPTLSRTGSLHITPFWTHDDAHSLDSALDQDGWSVGEAAPFRSTGWIDITRDRDALMAGFSKSARREVRRAERQNCVIRPITTPQEAHLFQGSLARLQETRRIGATPVAGFDAAFEDIYRHGETGLILGAWKDGDFLAGLLVYRSRDVVHGRHFTTEPDALRAAGNLRISPALWLEAMLWARGKGCRWMDVEGYETPVAGNPRHNIYKYKSELGPEVIERISERVRVLSPAIHLTGNLRGLLRKKLGPVYARWRRRGGTA